MAAKDDAVKKATEEVQEVKDVNKRAAKDSAEPTSADSAPTGAERHWAAEGGDVVTFHDEPAE